jgi:two-component system CheB/CheR fusion protein
VLDTLRPESIEVQTSAGTTYLLRLRPYRTTENAVVGAVITFTEVTGFKDTLAALRESDALRDWPEPRAMQSDAITVQDLEGRILAWNPGAVRMYGWTEIEALAMNISGVVPSGQAAQALAAVERLGRAEVVEPYHAQWVAKDGRTVEVTLTAVALVNGTGAVYALSTTEQGMEN